MVTEVTTPKGHLNQPGGVHQLSKMSQCLAAVTDTMFFFGRQLGGGFAEFGDEKERIIAETVGTARRSQKSALNGIAGGKDDPPLGIREGQGADETCGAL